MNPVLLTPRLRLRPMTAADFPLLRRFHSNPEVMKYISGGTTRTEEQSRLAFDVVLRLPNESPGAGGWMAEAIESGDVVGNFLLRPPNDPSAGEGFEIGYMFLPEFWGQGLASEGARRLLAYANQDLGLKRAVALIDPQHDGSRRVLTKLGFRFFKNGIYRDPSGKEYPSEILEVLLPIE